jgi:hypothetical protein
MIEVTSGKAAGMFTSFWNDGQEAEAHAAAERRAEEKGTTVRVERGGELLAMYRPSWARGGRAAVVRTYRSDRLGAVTMQGGSQMQVGTVVRDRKWGGRYTGTIVNVEGGSIFVQWHGTCVEDELSPADVTLAPEVDNPEGNGLRLMTYRSDRLGTVTIPEEDA